MADRIIFYRTDIANLGRSRISFELKSGQRKTVSFEAQDIGHFAAICAMLKHPIVEYELINNVHHFKSRNK